MRHLRILCIPMLTAVLVDVPTAQLAANDDAALTQVLRDWNRRQQSYRDARYVLEWRRTYPKGSLNGLAQMSIAEFSGDFPSSDTTFKNTMRLAFDFSNGKSRQEWEGRMFAGDDLKPRDHFEAHLSDGVHLQEFSPQKRNGMIRESDYAVELSNRAAKDFNPYFFASVAYPVFFAHGIVPCRAHAIVPVPLLAPAKQSAFSLHATLKEGDRTFLVVRTANLMSDREAFYEFWVDTARDSAVTRCLFYLNGRVNRRWDIKYRKVNETWIPTEWTDLFFMRGTLNESNRLRVVEFQPNPGFAANTFHMEPSPGMFFNDEHGKSFRQGEPGEPPIPAGEAIAQDRASKDRFKWFLIAGDVLVVLAALGSYMFWKSRRARKDSVGPHST